MNSKDIVARMTLEEKASLCSGLDFWHTKGVERLGLPSLMVTDGPHGLRKQAGDSDHLGIDNNVPSTCFPTACATASSFDRELLYKIGAAIGEECQQEQVATVLGPGVNIKRSPLCGRNFEYISEDPYVAGELAAALIMGVQSQGVGTSIKHFAGNNQETRRMSCNSVVDERALREIYLAGFERAIKKAQPWTVMCSYNQLDGVYLSENKRLLTDILRDEWGFEGIVMSDWGATDDRVQGVAAGLDLEMPGSYGYNDAKIVEAVKKGELKETDLDKVVVRMVDFILKAQREQKKDFRYDVKAHHELARKAAAESCVLLKNEEGLLPLRPGKSLAVIGAFARNPRYQGSGSSKINPSKMDTVYDVLTGMGIQFDYAPGYSLTPGSKPEQALIDEACRAAAGKDQILLLIGLPDEYESEGFDRTTLSIPQSHIKLLEAVSRVNKNIAVVLLCGSPVEMPWIGLTKSILLAYLGGQGGGYGCVDVLYGKVNPCGKLAESFPLQLDDTPCFKYFPGGSKSVEYRESIFVGYRYYDKAKKQIAFPFGYGLSYTSFTYSDLKLSSKSYCPGEDLTVSLSVKNIGNCPGAEVVQLYVGLKDSSIIRPEKELKGFEKVFLQPGESKNLTFHLDNRSFAYYNVVAKDWAIEGGTYKVEVAASSRDIRLAASVDVMGDDKETLLTGLMHKLPSYSNLPKGTLQIPDDEFETLYGRTLPPSERTSDEPFTINSTLNDLKNNPAGRKMIELLKEKLGSASGADLGPMLQAMLADMPLRSFVMIGGGAITPEMLEDIVKEANEKNI